MRLRNMLKICLVFCKSEPRYAYKRYAYKQKTCSEFDLPFKIKIEASDMYFYCLQVLAFPWNFHD